MYSPVIRSILTGLLIILASAAVMGQRASNKNVTRSIMEYPTIPMENVEKVAIRLYFPDQTVDHDTLAKYKSYRKLLKNDINVGLKKTRALQELQLVEEDWDILLEIAFQPTPVDSKRVMAGKFMGSDYVYYEIDYLTPTIAKVTNSEGELLSIWAEPSENLIEYGKAAKKEDRDTSVVYTWVRHSTVEDLEEDFQREGQAFLNRRAVKMQLGKVIDRLYDKLYFHTVKEKLPIASGRGGGHDYTALDDAQENAIEALESGNIDQLSSSISTWKTHLEQADGQDKKAFINAKIAAGLYKNLAIAYMYQDQYDDAFYALFQSMGLVGQEKSMDVLNILFERALGHYHNGQLDKATATTDPTQLKTPLIKGLKRGEYPLIVQDNQFASFDQVNRGFYNDLYMVLAPNTMAALAQAQAEANPFEAQVEQSGTAFAYLALDSYGQHADLAGGPMPARITELRGLHTLAATGMRFTSLPSNFGDLATVKKVLLADNQLTEIPASIGQLTSLTNLNLANNQLTTLPESIQNCTSLKKLNLSGNNISAAEMAKIESWVPSKCKIKS